MKRRITACLLLTMVMGVPAVAQDMIGVSWTGDVYSIDSSTGTSNFIGSSGLPTGSGVGVNAMTVDSAGVPYAAHRTTATQSQLYAIDTTTGAAVAASPVIAADIRGLAYDVGSGLFYIVNDHQSTGSSSDTLLTYDPNTQVLTTIGATGDSSLQSLEITPDGTIYAYSMNGLYAGTLVTLDRITGAVTYVNSTPNTVTDIQFLTAKDDQTIYAGRDGLGVIDAATGVYSTIFTSVGVDLRGCDFLDKGTGCFTTYGTGCPGSGGFTPNLTVTGCPTVGTTMSIDLTNALGGTSSVMLLGTGKADISAGFDCSLYAFPLLPLQIPLPLGGAGPGNGSVILPTVVPASAAGVTLTAQVFVLDPGVLGGFCASNGLELPFQ